MITIGLIGGIGSGKSTVAKMFRELGAIVIDADEIGHGVLCREDVKQSAFARWGEGVFDTSGELDRRKLAEIVFTDNPAGRKELAFLQSVTHPHIGREMSRALRAFENNGERVVVLDIPLLLEMDQKPSVDQVIFVDAARSVRLDRVVRRGWTEQELDRREASQMPLPEKRKRADQIIQNDGKIETTLDQIKSFWHNLQLKSY